ncbi:MAG: cobalt-precorrin-6A reductase [Rhodospirillales bacterium]|nr:cobalt-precorrin-6A reductase [Rhodospirillales bacterium]
MRERTRILLLGGTRDALELARRLVLDPRLDLTSSLAGRTWNPTRIPGELRVGGFGGPAGLAHYLKDHTINLLVDATHAFATTMAHNAAAACEQLGLPRLKLLRPAWRPVEGDRWIEVASTAEAAAALRGLAERVFLTSGRQEIEAFADLSDIWFLVRLIDPPGNPLPLARHEVILDRGPFDQAAETALMEKHGIQALVTKNSGGGLIQAKITAARRLGLPVVMIRRPEPPPGEIVESVEAALAWIEQRAGRPP